MSSRQSKEEDEEFAGIFLWATLFIAHCRSSIQVNCTLKSKVTRNTVITRSYYGWGDRKAKQPRICQLEKKNSSDKLTALWSLKHESELGL